MFVFTVFIPSKDHHEETGDQKAHKEPPHLSGVVKVKFRFLKESAKCQALGVTVTIENVELLW